MQTNQDSITISLADFLFQLRYRNKRIALAALLGLIAGLILFGVMKIRSDEPEFVSSSVIALIAEDEAGNFTRQNSTAPGMEDINMAVKSLETVSYLAKSDQILNGVINDTNYAIDIQNLRKRITITSIDNSQLLKIDVKWNSPQGAQQALNSILDQLPDAMQSSLRMGNISVINAPTLGKTKGDSKSLLMIPIGLAMGVLIEIIWTFLLVVFKPTYCDPEDIPGDILGVLPYDKEIKYNVVGNDRYKNAITGTTIILNRKCDGSKTLLYTSANGNEGTSVTLANTANELAFMGQNVLIIDANTKRPSISKLYDIEIDKYKTLNSIVDYDVDPATCVINAKKNIDIIPAYLDEKRIKLSPSVANKLQKLLDKYDKVLIDASPLSITQDVMYLQSLSPKTIYIVGQGKGSRKKLNNDVTQLLEAGMPVIGFVYCKN